jgi:hypothetical protein
MVQYGTNIQHEIDSNNKKTVQFLLLFVNPSKKAHKHLIASMPCFCERPKGRLACSANSVSGTNLLTTPGPCPKNSGGTYATQPSVFTKTPFWVGTKFISKNLKASKILFPIDHRHIQGSYLKSLFYLL